MTNQKDSSNNELSTFNDAKKKLYDLVWRLIPSRFRLPVAAIILITVFAFATYSFWHPLLDSIINKPPEALFVEGYVFEDENIPYKTKIKIIDKDRPVIGSKSDDCGFVSFNITSDGDPIRFLCYYQNNWKEIEIDKIQSNKLRNGSIFNLYLNSGILRFE